MNIRDLQHSDIPILMGWLNRFNSSFEYPGKRPIDDDCARGFFARFIDSPSLAAMVLEEDGRPVATLGFSIMPHPWNGEKIFFKAFWYSDKPRAGIRLYREALRLCRAGNVSQMVISSMTRQVNALLEREGFKPCEMNYVLDLNKD